MRVKMLELVAVPKSTVQYKRGVLAYNKRLQQFGTVYAGSLRGKLARRNLRNSWNPVRFCIISKEEIVEGYRDVLFTMKDGGVIEGNTSDWEVGDNVVSADKIILQHKDLMKCWVAVPEVNCKIGIFPYVRFNTLSATTIKIILDLGGNLWFEVEEGSNAFRLNLGDPIVHIKLPT